MSDDDYELIETIADKVPYVEFVMTGINIVKILHGWGSKSDEQRAIERLQTEIARLRHEIQALNRRIDELNVRIVQIENIARMRQIDNYFRDVDALVFELGRSPDLDELATIAKRLSLIVDSMYRDVDLWLWSDIGRRGDLMELTEPGFKILPLPVLASAISAFAMATSVHIGRDEGARSLYNDTFDRFKEYVSLRSDWVDESMPPVTIPERIRAEIKVTFFAATKYVTNGECVWAIYCTNSIERRTFLVREASFPYAADQEGALCMAPSHLGREDEVMLEDDYGPVVLLAGLEEALGKLRVSGSLITKPFVPFPTEVSVIAEVYAVRPNGDMLMYSCKMSDHLRQAGQQDMTWSTSGRVVGTAWQYARRIIVGYWNVLYAVQDDGSILWHRHDGAASGAPTWSGPTDVSPRDISLGHSAEDYIGDEFEGVYEVRRRWHSGGGSNPADVETRRSLVLLARDPRAGEARFSTPQTVSRDWDNYKIAFGNSGHVIFGISDDGDMYWHKCVDGGGGLRTLLGPRKVGAGWGEYRQVFGAGAGLILGVRPNGTMEAFWLMDWNDPPKPRRIPIGGEIATISQAEWRGPVRIAGPNWNGFRHIVPNFGFEVAVG
jgi:hypothetical protein